MNTETGEIVGQDEVDKMNAARRSIFRPIMRDLTAKEEFTRQISMYAPCGCGSGKKFKFCCKTK